MQSRSIEVQSFINAQRLSGYQVRVFLLCFLIMCLDGYDTVVVGYIAPALVHEWGLSKPQLAPMFGAGLFGLTIGSFLFGPLADRFGRKWVLIGSVAFFGVASWASAFADGLTTLAVLRFVTGLGLGGAMPNTYTIAAEFCPDARRATLVAPIGCGIAAGGAIGGLFAGAVMARWGWPGMLVLGGVLPLLLVPLLVAWLPESVRYQVQSKAPAERVARTLQRIAPGADLTGVHFTLAEPSRRGFPVKVLFAPGLAGGTVLLWATAFMALLVIYFLGNWLPILIHDTGLPLDSASRMTATYLTGNALGAIVLGLLMDRFNPQMVLACAFAVAGVSLACFGQLAAVPGIASVALFFAGTGTGGTMTGTNILSAAFYPTVNRATGVSWTLAMGRVGSVVGSMVGALLLAAHWPGATIFAVVSVPVFLGALSMVAMAVYRARQRRAAPSLLSA